MRYSERNAWFAEEAGEAKLRVRVKALSYGPFSNVPARFLSRELTERNDDQGESKGFQGESKGFQCESKGSMDRRCVLHVPWAKN